MGREDSSILTGVLARARGSAAGLLALAAPLATFTGLALVVLTASRLALIALYWDRVRAVTTLPALVPLALQFDAAVICAALLPVAFLVSFVPAAGRFRCTSVLAMIAWLAAWLAVLGFNEVATPGFIAEFGIRPNHLYVEYLNTPGVVLETVWRTQAGTVLLAALLAGGLIVGGSRLLRRAFRPAARPGLLVRLAWLVTVPLLLGIGVRGGLDHRPLAPSRAAIFVDPLVNDLILNSTYSVAHAVWQLGSEAELRQPYAQFPAAEVVAAVRADMQLPASAFPDPGKPTLHALNPGGQTASRPNIVILLQESLGARFFASLGGEPVATRLEAWRDRSLWFDEVYATGTRSARGIEAIVAGFPPSRTSSVIKLEGAQRNFFTIATALRARGYATEFIYGGDAAFDNMRRFFFGNGFDTVIDLHDLAPGAGFVTTWGVADEDLYARVHRELLARGSGSQPLFLLVFTTSNHPPYDFPDGRIALYEQPKKTRANAARYADWAAARYLDDASAAPYWPNTVVMLTADHDSRNDGNEAVPIAHNGYHIPAFIAGGPVQPGVVTRLASQMDLLPTLLSVAGIPARLPAAGIDLTRTDLRGAGRALMQYHDNEAYRSGDDVVMLVPGRAPTQYRLTGQRLVPAAIDPVLVRHAQAVAAWPLLAYKGGLYDPPADSPSMAPGAAAGLRDRWPGS